MAEVIKVRNAVSFEVVTDNTSSQVFSFEGMVAEVKSSQDQIEILNATIVGVKKRAGDFYAKLSTEQKAAVPAEEKTVLDIA